MVSGMFSKYSFAVPEMVCLLQWVGKVYSTLDLTMDWVGHPALYSTRNALEPVKVLL
jgi:hypothetical protein